MNQDPHIPVPTPGSINEPVATPHGPAETEPKDEPHKDEPHKDEPHKTAHHGHAEHDIDPDEMEEELDEAVEDGDAEVSHRAKPKPKGKR